MNSRKGSLIIKTPTLSVLPRDKNYIGKGKKAHGCFPSHLNPLNFAECQAVQNFIFQTALSFLIIILTT
jgi:hypothetical protein